MFVQILQEVDSVLLNFFFVGDFKIFKIEVFQVFYVREGY